MIISPTCKKILQILFADFCKVCSRPCNNFFGIRTINFIIVNACLAGRWIPSQSDGIGIWRVGIYWIRERWIGIIIIFQNYIGRRCGGIRIIGSHREIAGAGARVRAHATRQLKSVVGSRIEIRG